MISLTKQEKAYVNHQERTITMRKMNITNRSKIQWHRHVLPLMFFAAFTASGSAHADSCGKGKVLEVKEGGWNWNGLMIKIDYSVGATTASNLVKISG